MVAFGQRKSVSKVVAVIRNFGGGISQKEIISQTGLSERSVKAALKRLVTAKAVREFSIIDDLRRKTYSKR